MGQILRRVQLQELEELQSHSCKPSRKDHAKQKHCVDSFRDLQELPPELSIAVLSHLNATDLCLAACVWDGLANDEILWMGLCRDSWGYASIYNNKPSNLSYKSLYLTFDEAMLTFNFDVLEGEDYLIKKGLVNNEPLEMARFLHMTKRVKPEKKREYLEKRRDVLERMLELQNYENQFLPNALRNFFGVVSAPDQRGDYLTEIIDKFSKRFCTCNPQLDLSKDAVFVLCFSLIMLSVDLASPHVKNKMSKREFIKNTRRATEGVSDDFAGHLYDNIYLIGHVATGAR